MAISSTLSRLKKESKGFLGTNTPNEYNRFAGGSKSLTTPYISGYWYVFFQLPSMIGGSGSNTGDTPIPPSGAGNVASYSTWLTSAAEGFTPHSRNLTKVDLPGMGGMGSSFISGQQINRQFSITFGEYQNLPIYNTIRTWTAAFDEHEGVALTDLNGSKYKGIAHILLAKPQIIKDGHLTADDIEEYYGYDGVWPETSPIESMASDISTNDRATPAVQFNFDGNPLTKTDIGDTGLNTILAKFGNLNSYASLKSALTGVSTVSA